MHNPLAKGVTFLNRYFEATSFHFKNPFTLSDRSKDQIFNTKMCVLDLSSCNKTTVDLSRRPNQNISDMQILGKYCDMTVVTS